MNFKLRALALSTIKAATKALRAATPAPIDFGGSEAPKSDDPLAYNQKLLKLLPKLKKDLGALTVQQNYKGTGKQSHRRQVYIRFPNDQIDIFLENGRVNLGGVLHTNAGKILTKGKTPEQVYKELVVFLKKYAER